MFLVFPRFSWCSFFAFWWAENSFSFQMAPFRFWKYMLKHFRWFEVIISEVIWKECKARLFSMWLIHICLLVKSASIIKWCVYSKVLFTFHILVSVFAVRGFFCTFTCLSYNEQVYACLFQSLKFKETLLLNLILMCVLMFIFSISAIWKGDFCTSLHFVTGHLH